MKLLYDFGLFLLLSILVKVNVFFRVDFIFNNMGYCSSINETTVEVANGEREEKKNEKKYFAALLVLDADVSVVIVTSFSHIIYI